MTQFLTLTLPNPNSDFNHSSNLNPKTLPALAWIKKTPCEKKIRKYYSI